MPEQNYNLDFAQKFQQQFEFYFTGLVFTLLGLAVQTGKSAAHNWINYFELSGWICLMICGCVALHRLMMVPTLIRSQVELSRINTELGQLNIDLQNGHPPSTPIPTEDGSALTLSQAIEQHTQSKNDLETNVRKSHTWNSRKGWICMTTFLLALLFLIISRSSSLFIGCNPIL